MALTRDQLIEDFLTDPRRVQGPAPVKLRDAARFAALSPENQDVELKAWAGLRKTTLEEQATDAQAEADRLAALAADIDTAAKGL